MLQEGGTLPLNRAGAAGWVHDGHIWFVCARLADEVRGYLSQHESAQGVPGKDKNERLFDTWQESGAVRPSPDGGAIWRVRVECDAWRSPDALTVLCFPLDKLFADPKDYPVPMRGAVVPEAAPGPSAAGQPAPAAPATPPTRSPKASTTAPGATQPTTAPGAAPARPAAHPITTAPATSQVAAGVQPEETGATQVASPSPANKPSPTKTTSAGSAAASQAADARPSVAPPDPEPAPVAEAPQAPAQDAHTPARPVAAPLGRQPSMNSTRGHAVDDVLPAAESARLIEPLSEAPMVPAAAAGLTVGAPLRPHDPGAGKTPRPRKGPTPAAEAFVAWVAHAIGTGELKYNEDQAIVHFVPEGCLLLSPEVFRRFIELHRDRTDGPVFDLIQAQGDRAFARLQNELAKSGWTQRNGDENMHAYAFVKADGNLSRPASFFLLPKPELFWNPVPQPNDRIRKVQPVKKLSVPARPTA
jgi:hypothetical protein